MKSQTPEKHTFVDFVHLKRDYNALKDEHEKLLKKRVSKTNVLPTLKGDATVVARATSGGTVRNGAQVGGVGAFWQQKALFTPPSLPHFLMQMLSEVDDVPWHLVKKMFFRCNLQLSIPVLSQESFVFHRLVLYVQYMLRMFMLRQCTLNNLNWLFKQRRLR